MAVAAVSSGGDYFGWGREEDEGQGGASWATWLTGPRVGLARAERWRGMELGGCLGWVVARMGQVAAAGLLTVRPGRRGRVGRLGLGMLLG